MLVAKRVLSVAKEQTDISSAILLSKNQNQPEFYSAETRAQRRYISELLRESREMMKEMEKCVDSRVVL